MKKRKKFLKTTLCMALTAILLLSEMPAIALAAEDTSETETAAEESAAGERAEETKTEDTETEEVKTDADEETTAEELLTEAASLEIVPTEVVAEETEAFENDLKLAFSDTDIANGKDGDITWVIDKDGKLTIEGTGDYSRSQGYMAPWYENRASIKSAVVNVKGMKNAASMFYDCTNLTDVNLSKFDTSSVTKMGAMFRGCSSLTSLDVSKFDTSSVTSMGQMFMGCSGLTSLDISNFNTSNVADMGSMFRECSGLTSLDVSKFDTGSVTDVMYMFFGCSGLTSLDISDFNTSNMQSMFGMFRDCSSLTSLDVSKFETSSVTKMGQMFCGCHSLTSLDVSKFDTSNVTNMNAMFMYCRSLTSLDVSDFNTSSVTNMENMFLGCENLANLDVGKFNTSSVTNMGEMFRECSSLTSLDVSKFDTSSVTNMEEMFYSCSGLTSLDVSSFDMGSVTNTGNMFYNCRGLTAVYTPHNLKMETVLLPSGKKWHDTAGNEYTYLPANKAESILLVCEGSAVPAVRITAQKTKTAYYCGDTIDTDDITVIYYSADGTAKKVTGFTTNADSIEMQTAGTPALTVTYTPEGGTAQPLTADIKLTVAYSAAEVMTVTLPEETYVYSGKPHRPIPIVTATVNGSAKTLTEKTDYTVSYRNNVDVYEGSGSEASDEAPAVIVKGCGEYRGTVIKNFAIKKADETIEYYTVTFNLNGHGVDITNTGVKAGSLIEKLADPKASGFDFTGWYTDSACTKKWDFEKDTVASNTTLYAGWVKEGEGGNSGSDDDKEDDYYQYTDDEQTDLKTQAKAEISAIKAKVYDGSAYEPVIKVTVTEGGKSITLTEGADYRVLYENNINAGTGKVIVKGNGIYKGQLEQPLTINPKPVNKLKVLADDTVEGAFSTSDLSTLHVCVYDGTKQLQYGTDYMLSGYKAPKKANAAAEITVTGTGNYSGTTTAKFTVYENGTQMIPSGDIKLEGAKAKEAIPSYPYTGKAVTPKVTVGTLAPSDYKVQYQNNKDAGTAYAIVMGKKAYRGKAIIPFIITAETVANPNDFTIKEIKQVTYNGKLQKPSITVTMKKDGKDKKLSKKDYTVVYKDNFHAGDATVTVTGKGNYAGLSATAKFTINQQEIKKASLKGTQGSLTLTYNKKKLKEGTDYETPTYETNGNKVKVKITGKGDFKGTMEKSVKTS